MRAEQATTAVTIRCSMNADKDDFTKFLRSLTDEEEAFEPSSEELRDGWNALESFLS